jgi:acylphosphatase
MPIARSITVIGHVQGVFFREWTLRVAAQLGVAGWVRNRSDGSVEIYAVGSADQLDRFASELRSGSPASRVDKVEMENAPVQAVRCFVRRSSD